MKKLYFLFFFFTVAVFGLELSVSTGMHDSRQYSVLNITHNNEFKCTNIATPKNPQDRYICKFKEIPLAYPQKTENSFFFINPVVEKDGMFVEIIPKKNSYLVQLKKNEKNLYSWIIIGYEDKLPFIIKDEKEGLNFPIEIKNDSLFYVGLLDIDKKPFIKNDKDAEIKELLKIKKTYEENRADDVIAEVDNSIKQFPNSLFLPELLVYKLRALSAKTGNEKSIIDIGKIWIDNFTTHKDLPEVMLLVAKASIDLGYTKDADYYMDILINDYNKNLFSQMAMIYKADRYKSSTKEDKAIALYKKVLTETTDIQMASIAASRLAKIHISLGEIESGVEYYTKIFQSNPTFFVQEPMSGYELALSLTSYSKFKLSAGISDMVLSKLEKNDPNKKEVLLNSARWHAKAKDVAIAKERYEEYIKKYPFEGNIEQVKTEYDNLFFDMKDDNTSTKIANYDNLIEKYVDSEIGKRAFYEKIILLANEKRFDEIKKDIGKFTKLESSLFPDIEKTSSKIINEMFLHYLLANKCNDAIFVYKNYSVKVDSTYDEKIFNCSYNAFEYEMANNLCDKNIEASSGVFALNWIGKKIDVMEKINNTKRVSIIGEDYIKTMALFGKKIALDKYMKIFKAFFAQGEHSKVLNTAIEIEKIYPEAINIAEIYSSALKSAQKLEDLKMVLLFSEKLYNYQERKKITTYTPWVEFVYADTLYKLKRYKDAIVALQKLLQGNLAKEDRAKALYYLSTNLDMIGAFDISKDVLKRCVALNSNDKYSILCKESVSILDNK